MSRLLIVLCGLALSGCMTAEEIAARDAAIAEQQAQQADAYCQGISARPGTDAYIQCRMGVDQMRQQQAIADQAQAAAYQRQIQAQYANRQLNCTSNTFGTQTTTNCY